MEGSSSCWATTVFWRNIFFHVIWKLILENFHLDSVSAVGIHLSKHDEEVLHSAACRLLNDLSTSILRAVNKPQISVAVNSSACSKQNMFLHLFLCLICTEHNTVLHSSLSAFPLHITKPVPSIDTLSADRQQKLYKSARRQKVSMHIWFELTSKEVFCNYITYTFFLQIYRTCRYRERRKD